MKSTIITVVLFTLASIISFTGHAQETTLAQESRVNYEGTVIDSWSIVTDAPADEIKRAWKDYLEDSYEANVKGLGLFSNAKVLTAEGLTIDSFAMSSTDLFLEVLDAGEGSRIGLFARVGGSFLTSGEEQFNTLGSLLTAFLKGYLPSYHQQTVSNTQEELDKLVRKRDNLKEDIQKNEEEMLKMEQEILELKKENENNSYELEQMEQNILKASDRLKERQDKLTEIKQKFQ